MSSRITPPEYQSKSKSYNVILEYLNISILSDNINYETNTINLSNQSEHILITIKHYHPTISNLKLPALLTANPAITHNDIIQYWDKLSNDIKTKQHNCIAPLYLADDNLILGVIIFGNGDWKNYKLLETFNLLSTINYSNDAKPDAKHNVILGIIKNPVFKKILENKNIIYDDGNLLGKVKWYYIFQNMANYLPKLAIIRKEKVNTSINFFQNRLNP